MTQDPEIRERATNISYCTECRQPMELKSETDEYYCVSCGMVKLSIGGGLLDDVQVESRSGASSFYSVNKCGNKNRVLEKLKANQQDYASAQKMYIDIEILDETSDIFKKIQDIFAENASIVKREKMDDILAAVLFYVCIKKKIPMYKKDIQEFMKLSKNGFSKGDDLVRCLANKGFINLQVNGYVINDNINFYLQKLDIDASCSEFVCSLLNLAKKHKICPVSKDSSKLAGALWMITKIKKPQTTITAFETIVDRCRRVTYIKFCKSIVEEAEKFKPLFDEYNMTFVKEY